MKPEYLTDHKLNAFISAALNEDIGDGDHSTLASIPEDAVRHARLLVKQPGVIAGIDLARNIFKALDSNIEFNPVLKDGERVETGNEVFRVSGNAKSILTAERTVLNCMQRMSAIATLTRHLADKISHTNTKILDTRKTTPNFRIIEKWAVYLGGGVNHRMGLYDMIMLKDNHIDFVGGVEKAIENVLHYLKNNGLNLPIVVETRNREEVLSTLKFAEVNRILLDNFQPDQLADMIRLIDKAKTTEASGNIDENTIQAYAETGVDFISVGALTHSVKSLDLSLKAV